MACPVSVRASTLRKIKIFNSVRGRRRSREGVSIAKTANKKSAGRIPRPSPINFASPIFNFRDNEHLSVLLFFYSRDLGTQAKAKHTHCSESHQQYRTGDDHLGFYRCFLFHLLLFKCVILDLTLSFCRKLVPCRWQQDYCSTNSSCRSILPIKYLCTSTACGATCSTRTTSHLPRA
jgi:hypothetical protein